MFTNRVHVLSITLFSALQAVVFVTAQSAVVETNNNTAIVWNVSSATADYILESNRQYNATLKGFLDEINAVSQSMTDQLKPMEKTRDQLLETIRQTNEKYDPMEVLSLPTKYCVQQYKAELPYADVVKASIESCLISARSAVPSLVVTPNQYYTNLYNYYNADFKNALAACTKTFPNQGLNYTLCVTSTITKGNAYTVNYRNAFATAMQASTCALNARIDSLVSCTYTYYNSALASIGAASRLIDDCISGYLTNTPTQPCNSCPVIYYAVKDADFSNATIKNPLIGLSKSQSCVQIIYS